MRSPKQALPEAERPPFFAPYPTRWYGSAALIINREGRCSVERPQFPPRRSREGITWKTVSGGALHCDMCSAAVVSAVR